MGKATGFIDYKRLDNYTMPPKERIKSYGKLHAPLPEDERALQAARCMDCGVPFCQSGFDVMGKTYGCPLHNLIPEWNDNLYHGNWDTALSRLLKTNNFPEFTGRVCPALCENACTCGIDSEPVAIRENELSIIEKGFQNGKIAPGAPAAKSGKKVAVIGSGPSGLAAADQLNRRGHAVTVLEKDSRAGGLMMYGIPEMKLPKDIIDRRISLMEAQGVVFQTSCEVGSDISAQELSDNYDCVILCCGASKHREMTIAGDCSVGVSYATDYLKTSFCEGKNIALANGKDVVIVGAGDTATDCVATAIRQGCKSVTQLVRKSKAGYETIDSLFPTCRKPQYKTDYGHQEAIAAFGKDPRIHEVQVVSLTSDEDGNLTGVEITGGNVLPAGLLILATGFSGCDDKLLNSFGAEPDSCGNAKTQENGYSLGGKLFAAGDMRRGQSLVVWAIDEGRHVAYEADKYLMGYSNL